MLSKNWRWTIDLPDNEQKKMLHESRVFNLIRGNQKTYLLLKMYCLLRSISGISIDLLYYLLFNRDKKTNICYFNLPNKKDFCGQSGLLRVKDRSPKINTLAYHIKLLTDKGILVRNSMNSYSVNLPKEILSIIDATDFEVSYSIKLNIKEEVKIIIQCQKKKV